MSINALKHELETEDFLKLVEIDWDDVCYESESESSLYFISGEEIIYYGLNFDIKPYEFLEFARKDLETNEMRGLINALGNSKRAINSQIDKILQIFGIKSNKKFLSNFPSKLEFLQDMGIIAPSITRKVVKARNFLEHEYKYPDEEQVKDAIDIAELFIEATNRIFESFTDSFFVFNKKERSIEVKFDSENKMFELIFYKDPEVFITEINFQNKELYLTLLKFAISIRNSKKI
jgi:hypothetical protein